MYHVAVQEANAILDCIKITVDYKLQEAYKMYSKCKVNAQNFNIYR